ncbi:MAG: carotenoid 1,2-hydratase [Betaproteobacteria bacterium]|nr:carotenoid 1,2-hydratase [Betaproteobacteria bacterium]
MSDDHQHGLTLIAFVGSVFSPYYAWARSRGLCDPDNHCALNVALYGRGPRRWTMTERGRRFCQRDATQFSIGPSQLTWDGSALTVNIDEVGAPWPRRVRGQVKIWPHQLFSYSIPLDASGAHRWGPLAPSARIEVELQEPDLRWRGHAYLDSNEGDEPIEKAFHHWNWSRMAWPDGSTQVVYDMQWPDRAERVLNLRFGADGQVTEQAADPVQALSPTAWRVHRRARSAHPVSLHEQLEDTPFYQRCWLRQRARGVDGLAFHETLSVPRLVSPVVRSMLPWRMPRRS